LHSWVRQAERDQDVRPGLMPPRVKQDAELTPEIRRVFDETFQVYGVRKVWRRWSSSAWVK
jgi:hypothetical protein